MLTFYFFFFFFFFFSFFLFFFFFFLCVVEMVQLRCCSWFFGSPQFLFHSCFRVQTCTVTCSKPLTLILAEGYFGFKSLLLAFTLTDPLSRLEVQLWLTGTGNLREKSTSFQKSLLEESVSSCFLPCVMGRSGSSSHCVAEWQSSADSSAVTSTLPPRRTSGRQDSRYCKG